MALFGYPACAEASGATKVQQSAAMTSPTKRSMAFSLGARPQHGFVASLGCRRLAAQAQLGLRFRPSCRNAALRENGPQMGATLSDACCAGRRGSLFWPAIREITRARSSPWLRL